MSTWKILSFKFYHNRDHVDFLIILQRGSFKSKDLELGQHVIDIWIPRVNDWPNVNTIIFM